MNTGKSYVVTCPDCGKSIQKRKLCFSCSCPDCGAEMKYDPDKLKPVLIDLVQIKLI